MRVKLIRHGITDANIRKAYIGKTDEPLNDIGMHMFAMVDIFAPIVYVSEKTRVKQTARILYPKAKQIEVPEFNEMDFGDFEGKTAKELEHDTDYIEWVESGCTSRCPNGETKREFSTRCKIGFLSILDSTTDDIIIIAHAGTIMAICDTFIMSDKTYFDWHIDCGEELNFNWNGKLLEEL